MLPAVARLVPASRKATLCRAFASQASKVCWQLVTGPCGAPANASSLRSPREMFHLYHVQPGLLQRLLNDESPSQPPLSEDFPGTPALSAKSATAPKTQITTLSNGLRVASHDMGGAVSSVGVYIKAGSRYESVPGSACVLEHMAFSSTLERSAIKLARDAEDAGVVLSARATRETFTYGSEQLRGQTGAAVDVLSEAVTRPRLADWEVAEQKAVLSELLKATSASNARTSIVEGIHAAAYGSSSAFGHSTIASDSDLEDVSADVLRSFLGARFQAGNMVVVSTNVNHDALVETVDKYLLSLPEGVPVTAASQGPSTTIHGPEKPTFLGGQTLLRTHEGGVSHVALALPAPSLQSKEVHALGVLQALLGSTGAHGAAGAVRLGPQKHSRIARSLHTEAHSFIRSLTAFALPYSDTGLLGLVGSTADHEAGRLVDVMAGFLKDAASLPIVSAELERAKKQYKLALVSEVESRVGARDELGLSVLLGAGATPIDATLKAVDAVTAHDVQAVAKAALASGKVAVSAIGSLTTLPRYDVIASLLK